MPDEIQKPQPWKWEKKLKPKHYGLIFLGGLILIIIICAVTGGEKKTETPQIPFSQQAVTEISIREAIEHLRGVSVELEGNITKIEVIDYAGTLEIPDDKIVIVYYKPESIWDEKHAIRIAVHTAIKTMETLFENPKVAEVVMRQQGDFTDKYGETTTETAVRIKMDKETANKIANWEVVDDRAFGDYNTFFDLAELQYVHPAIGKAL